MDDGLTALEIGGEGTAIATRVRSCLVITAPADLGGRNLDMLEKVASDAMQEPGTTSMVLELSGVKLMDRHEYARIKRLLQTAKFLGVEAMLVGLRPGIIAHLVQSDADLCGVHAALGLDDALARLGS